MKMSEILKMEAEKEKKRKLEKEERKKEIISLKKKVEVLSQENKKLKKMSIFCPFCGTKIESK